MRNKDLPFFLNPRDNWEGEITNVGDQPWMIEPNSEQWKALENQLKENWLFSPKMVQEYKEIHRKLGPMSELVLNMRISSDIRDRQLIEGRSVHIPINAGTCIIDGHSLPYEWSLNTKGSPRGRFQEFNPIMRIMQTLPQHLIFFDALESSENASASRISEYQYSETAREEYVKWLIAFKKIIKVNNITSLTECLDRGIPIMLLPSYQPRVSEAMNYLLEEREFHFMKNPDDTTTKSQIQQWESFEKTKRKIKRGFASTSLLLPGISRVKTHILESKKDYVLNGDLRALGETLAHMLDIGLLYEQDSSHTQQIVMRSNSKVEYPIADFMDIVDLGNLELGDRILYIFTSLRFMINDIADTIGDTHDRTKDKDTHDIKGESEYEKLEDLFSGLMSNMDIFSKQEGFFISNIAYLYGINYAIFYVANKYAINIGLVEKSKENEENESMLKLLGQRENETQKFNEAERKIEYLPKVRNVSRMMLFDYTFAYFLKTLTPEQIPIVLKNIELLRTRTRIDTLCGEDLVKMKAQLKPIIKESVSNPTS